MCACACALQRAATRALRRRRRGLYAATHILLRHRNHQEGSKEWAVHGWEEVQGLGEELENEAGLYSEVVLDDRHTHTIGRRMKAADRMGYPIIVVCGRSTTEQPPWYELYRSKRVGYSAPVLQTRAELLATLATKANVTKVDVNPKEI
ncbi:unnamed protein product [Parnassius mnemosyne]|uniref:Anticodon-binding domain-containing protein n=1 Tax=Parnassius mnemosyne TaxID=213953 RepID=A0AAV1LV80_9NEOP